MDRTLCRLAYVTAMLAAATLASAAFADPIAVIAGLKGKVEITTAKGGAPQRAALGRALEKGDWVKVPAGGTATVLFSDGNVLDIAGTSSVRVGGQATTPGAKGLPSDVFTSVKKFVAGGSRETGLVALSQLRSAPVDKDAPFLIAPRRTALLTDRPTFAWRAVPGATRYRVTLSSAEGGKVWDREATGLSLPFPAESPALAGGAEYLWALEALADTRALRSETSVFQVLPATEAAAVRLNLGRIGDSAGGIESPAARFISGSYLSGLGLFLDASEQFGALCKLVPDSPAPHKALGDVYSSIGLMDLAAAEFQVALSLTREP
jgi:hypothetical protein